MNTTYRLWIQGAYTPETMPLARLADYMSALASLLGEGTQVHFEGLETGSAIVCASVEEPAAPKVASRVQGFATDEASDEVARAFARVDDLLHSDNATGELLAEGATIIRFPGRNRPTRFSYGPFRQEGSLNGKVIRVGGREPTIPVHLQDADVTHTGLHASADLARKIAQLMLGPVIRVYGQGVWFRTGLGDWELRSFKIQDFEELDQSDLQSSIERIRSQTAETWRGQAILEDEPL